MTKIADVKKDKKKNYSFYSAAEYGRDFPRLYTGIFAFDYCTAGVPVGVTSSFYGPPGGAKSSTGFKLLASGQNTCWNCFEFLWDCKCDQQTVKKSVVVSTEGMDLDWVEKMGVDIDALEIVEPTTGEEAVDIIWECLNADDCGIVLLDSFTRIFPEAEILDPALQNHMGKRGQLHTKLINKVKAALMVQKRRKQHTMFVAVNQIRAKYDAQGRGSNEEMSGCFASKHDFHLTCRFGPLKTEAQYVDKVSELPKYGKFSVNIVSPGGKRKLFTLAGKGYFYLALENTDECLVGTSYDFKSAFEYAKDLGLMDGWNFKYSDKKFKTKAEMMTYWTENPFDYMTIKRRIVEHAANVKRGIIEDLSPKEEKKSTDNEEA